MLVRFEAEVPVDDTSRDGLVTALFQQSAPDPQLRALWETTLASGRRQGGRRGRGPAERLRGAAALQVDGLWSPKSPLGGSSPREGECGRNCPHALGRPV